MEDRARHSDGLRLGASLNGSDVDEDFVNALQDSFRSVDAEMSQPIDKDDEEDEEIVQRPALDSEPSKDIPVENALKDRTLEILLSIAANILT